MLDPSGCVGTDLHHLFDRRGVEGRQKGLLLCQPECGEAHKVGGETGEVLLEQERLRRTDLEMVHLEDIFAFLDASLNGLTAVVAVKPAIQVSSGIIITEMHKHRVAYALADLVASQGEIDWIGEVAVSRAVRPSRKSGVAAHSLPDSLW